VPRPEPFTDIHGHFLPGIDDGADDWGTSLAMARMAVDEGFRTIVATPHQLGGYAVNSGDVIRQLTVEYQQRLDAESIVLQVLPGADVRIEDGMIDRLRRGDVLTLGDQGRHVLLNYLMNFICRLRVCLSNSRRLESSEFFLIRNETRGFCVSQAF